MLAIIVVYLLGLASHALTAPDWLDRGGLIAFALVQLLLLWSWYALHVKRLRDAGHVPAPAVGVALIYLLALVLLLMILTFFMQSGEQSIASGDRLPGSGVLALYMILFVFGVFGNFGDVGILNVTAALVVLILASPILIVTGFTLWAATRPSATPSPSAA